MAKYEVKAFPMYSEAHTWVRKMIDGSYKIGISDYAQQQQGDIVYADLPDEGDAIVQGEAFGSIESGKAVSDLVAPVSGTITEVNEEVMDAPEVLNSSCYDNGWIITIEPTDYDGEKGKLMDAKAYREFLENIES